MFKEEDFEKVRWVKAIAKRSKDILHRRAVHNCNILLKTRQITNEKFDDILQIAFMYWTHVSKTTKDKKSRTYLQALELFEWATDMDMNRRVKVKK